MDMSKCYIQVLIPRAAFGKKFFVRILPYIADVCESGPVPLFSGPNPVGSCLK
jgi:hypothetical protein